jgi:agmatinase
MARLSEQWDFLGLAASGLRPTFESARAVVWPIPYERTTSYVKGTARGPEALLTASHQVELYDEELDWVIAELGIGTLDPFDDRGLSEEDALARLTQECMDLLRAGKFVVGIGGEHTVTVGLVRAHAQHVPELWVIQIDAHSDFRSTYEGSRFNHACVMARVQEVAPFVGVGIRSTDGSEKEGLRPPSRFFYAHEMRRDSSWMERVVASIAGERVYVTIDLDALDPAEMPSVGTPEPGGLGWVELLTFLRRLAVEKEVVGFDVVELCPQPGQHRGDFLAAKLVYKFLGYVFGRGKMA